ncbi:MAG: hypothetical protein AAGC60_05725 [Acidobacteriota bacterium]
MAETVEGQFIEGRVELDEEPKVRSARVLVTFLPESAPAERKARVEHLFDAWERDPLPPEERDILETFDSFQEQHPLVLSKAFDDS